MAYPGQYPRKHRLIPDWRHSWRFLSVQVNAGVAALAAAIFAAAPGLVIDAVTGPPLQRVIVGVMIAGAFILPHWLARILKQKKRHGCD